MFVQSLIKSCLATLGELIGEVGKVYCALVEPQSYLRTVTLVAVIECALEVLEKDLLRRELTRTLPVVFLLFDLVLLAPTAQFILPTFPELPLDHFHLLLVLCNSFLEFDNSLIRNLLVAFWLLWEGLRLVHEVEGEILHAGRSEAW